MIFSQWAAMVLMFGRLGALALLLLSGFGYTQIWRKPKRKTASMQLKMRLRMTKPKPKIMAFAPLLIFAALIAMFAFGMWGNRVSKDASPLIGKSIQTSIIPSLYGQDFQIGGKTAKPIIVNFFASWCAPCRLENPALLELAQSDEIILIGIAYRDDPKNTKDFIETLGNPYAQIGVDRQGNTGALFGLSGVPETYIINREGIIIYKHKGEVRREDIPKLVSLIRN